MTRGCLALLNKLRDELAHALVAPVEDGALWLSPMSGLSIMYCRLLMTAGGLQIGPPAGISG